RRRRFHESLCHDHWRGVWSARCGAHLAGHRGRSRPGEEPLVHCHHPCRSGSLFLGLALTQAHLALLTLIRLRTAIREAIIMSDVNGPYSSFDRDALSRVARAGVLTGVIDGLFSSVLSVAFYNSTVSRLFQGVASTLLGAEAFNGGALTAAIGVLMHFGVTFGWSIVLLLVVKRASWIRGLLNS